jgi:hypothetical protein
VVVVVVVVMMMMMMRAFTLFYKVQPATFCDYQTIRFLALVLQTRDFSLVNYQMIIMIHEWKKKLWKLNCISSAGSFP